MKTLWISTTRRRCLRRSLSAAACHGGVHVSGETRRAHAHPLPALRPDVEGGRGSAWRHLRPAAETCAIGCYRRAEASELRGVPNPRGVRRLAWRHRSAHADGIEPGTNGTTALAPMLAAALAINEAFGMLRVIFRPRSPHRRARSLDLEFRVTRGWRPQAMNPR